MNSDSPNLTHSTESPSCTPENDGQTLEIKKSLRRLDRKDSWYWWNAVLVITLLMGAIVVLSLPKILPDDDPSDNVQLSVAVRGLLGLVLIFNVYTLYQQHLLRQLEIIWPDRSRSPPSKQFAPKRSTS